jgi:hypothetical protein
MMKFEELDAYIKFAIEHKEQVEPKRLAAIAEKIVRQLAENHALRLYLQHIDREGATNTRPEHALGEQLWATMCLAGVAAKQPPDLKILLNDKELESYYGATMAYFIMQAQPYLWSDKCEKMADAAPLPKHVLSRSILPMPIMFWSRETGYVMNASEDRDRFETNWMLAMHCGDRLQITHDEVYGSRGQRTSAEFRIIDIPYGLTWPDDFGDNADEIGRLLKRFAFLNSPYTTHSAHGLPRHIRRQMQRGGEPPMPQKDVRVVALRRPSEHHDPAGEHIDMNWQHHWWVTGHYRAQWYPSEKAHRVLWIAPYVKGDLTKPLLEKIYTVIR